MRKILYQDEYKNEYISELEAIYNLSPDMFYHMINRFIEPAKDMFKAPIGYLTFSTKTECMKVPERIKIYPATIWQPYFEVFILSNQKELLNQDSLKTHIDLITGEGQFPQIILIASNEKNKQKIQSLLTQVLPEQNDDMHYNAVVITRKDFHLDFEITKKLVIKDLSRKLKKLTSDTAVKRTEERIRKLLT